MRRKGPGNRAGEVFPSPVFDPEITMASVQGDVGLLGEVIDLLLETSPTNLSQINEAIATGNSRGLERSADDLKGAVKIFGSQHFCESSSELDKWAVVET